MWGIYTLVHSYKTGSHSSPGLPRGPAAAGMAPDATSGLACTSKPPKPGQSRKQKQRRNRAFMSVFAPDFRNSYAARVTDLYLDDTRIVRANPLRSRLARVRA